jgi:GTP-binding protein EngB required for normal cell division
MRFKAIDLEAFCSMFPLTLFMIMIISLVPEIDFYEQQGIGGIRASMIEGYLKNSPNLSAVVVLLDSRRELDERDVQLIEWLRQYDIPVIYALTKIDKLNRQETDRARRSTSAGLGISDELVLTSAKSGQGIKELWG